ncbi:type I toxin-antitoxin system Fst family toxin, partial [Lactococcus lactis]
TIVTLRFKDNINNFWRTFLEHYCLRKEVNYMLQILFVTVVAPLVVGVALEIIKSWLKDQHNKRH